MRDSRGAPVCGAAAPGEHLLSREGHDRVRRKNRDDQGQQEGERVADARVPEGIRGPGIVRAQDDNRFAITRHDSAG